MRQTLNIVAVLVGLILLSWAGPAGAQDMECAIITKIAGGQIVLTPENKNLKPFVIESEDTAGLKVGDRVWVKDGKIVSCALPGRGPYPAPKR